MQRVLRQWTASDGRLHGEWCYPAEDVDDYMKSVKALVEAGKNLAIKSAENKGDITAEDFGKLWQAIAAAEALWKDE